MKWEHHDSVEYTKLILNDINRFPYHITEWLTQAMELYLRWDFILPNKVTHFPHTHMKTRKHVLPMLPVVISGWWREGHFLVLLSCISYKMAAPRVPQARLGPLLSRAPSDSEPTIKFSSSGRCAIAGCFWLTWVNLETARASSQLPLWL